MLFALTLANLKMIVRNRQALFWALAFPLIFVVVFGLFNLDGSPNTAILVVDHAQDQVSRGLVESLSTLQNFTVNERQDETTARKDLEDGEFRYLLLIPQGLAESVAQQPENPISITLLYDRSSSSAPIILGLVRRYVAEANKRLVQAPTLIQLEVEGVQSRQLNYFDFLLPGFVGMGVMTYAIIGLASTMASYREQKILKRILATPLRVRTFFAAQIAAFLILSVFQSAIILAAGIFIFGANVYGNFLYLFILVILANIVFLNLGFIVGAISKNGRAADGLANAVSMPMMFLSGTFFPIDGLPDVLGALVRYLPLAPMLDAMRGVALEARPIWDFPEELAILGVWILVSSAVAVKIFRFD
jgi:ABC-2 type transport system permease protein